MTYRRTNRYKSRIRALQEGRARARMERAAVERWQPPDHRRRLIVEDYDTGTITRTVFDLYRTPRIDVYRIAINGVMRKQQMGWTKLLEQVRLAVPRKCSPRWADEQIGYP